MKLLSKIFPFIDIALFLFVYWQAKETFIPLIAQLVSQMP